MQVLLKRYFLSLLGEHRPRTSSTATTLRFPRGSTASLNPFLAEGYVACDA